VVMIHRRDSFRGHLDSVQKVIDMSASGKIKLVLEAEVVGVNGADKLSHITIKKNSGENFEINTEYWLPLYGLSPDLGPIADWGLNLDSKSIVVNTFDYSTNVPGIFAVGDINEYPGKLKLILCGFHEATLMVQSAFARVYPNKKKHFKYTTVTGIDGF
jgi:thioredoxin reductase (NADPH)